MKLFQSKFALLITTLTLATACTKQSSPSLQQFLGGEEQGIFSNRPQSRDQLIAVVKLSAPPALTAIVQADGKRSVDPTLLKQIDQEQEATILALKSLSSEVRILYRYRMILNAITVLAPASLEDKIRGMGSVSYVESAGDFARPAVLATPLDSNAGAGEDMKERNSVKFIGALKVHQMKTRDSAGKELPVDGSGMKVGIIDTGIDYTHTMFGGAGSAEAYQGVNPNKANLGFPNKKVVGGIDLVGTTFNSASPDFALHIPTPDENPLDEAGHGTHVAGTVAGLGDDVNTYTGVAPGASLFAIKVFGKTGSTSDPVVIAAMEYAADPNKDGQLDDQLDVINMSLGSSYGNPHILYGEAIKNLSLGGTVVVASAGNSGPQDYIVGAPSVAEEAISVAASVDDSLHNWQFRAVKITGASLGEKLAEAVEAAIAKPIAESGAVTGKLVYLGIADKDLSDDEKAKLLGNVAFIDRGKVTFAEKLKRAADAGAIGVVVANNQAGAAFTMGGDGKIAIPAIMITQALGDLVKKDLATGVQIEFATSQRIEKPNLIDTLTSFSSKGPRSLDALLKPEISSPGQDITSAAMGEGNKGVRLSGTSMAGPHVAGVMALLKQSHASLSSRELKSLLMGQAVAIKSETGANYPLSQQGAGRVQVDKSAVAPFVSETVAISLGEMSLLGSKTIRTKATLKNLSDDDYILLVRLTGDKGLSMAPLSVKIAKKSSQVINLNVQVQASGFTESIKELGGVIEFVSGDVLHRIPVIAIARKISNLHAQTLKIAATSEEESAGSSADVAISNSSPIDGEVLAFNLLGTDTRKPNQTNDEALNRACDLQSVGYRIVEKLVDGKNTKVLQVAGKLYQPMTTWHSCELSVLIDSDDDQKPEQELALVNADSIAGLASPGTSGKFLSLLLDATKARKIRADFEAGMKDPSKKVDENYSTAIVDGSAAKLYNNSTVIVVEAPISELARRESGELAIKVATIHNESSSAKMDDFLPTDNWMKISLNETSHPFYGMPESVSVHSGETTTLEMTKGEESGNLLLLYPQNRTVFSDVLNDKQSEVLTGQFQN